mmetsp:Transcript_2774/g.3839  ORF Transcript_2774/g.3839 Transcript_2774/m.3839 type:complete len:360 (-) Transcript_2774:664-1743(-)
MSTFEDMQHAGVPAADLPVERRRHALEERVTVIAETEIHRNQLGEVVVGQQTGRQGLFLAVESEQVLGDLQGRHAHASLRQRGDVDAVGGPPLHGLHQLAGGQGLKSGAVADVHHGVQGIVEVAGLGQQSSAGLLQEIAGGVQQLLVGGVPTAGLHQAAMQLSVFRGGAGGAAGSRVPEVPEGQRAVPSEAGRLDERAVDLGRGLDAGSQVLNGGGALQQVLLQAPHPPPQPRIVHLRVPQKLRQLQDQCRTDLLRAAADGGHLEDGRAHLLAAAASDQRRRAPLPGPITVRITVRITVCIAVRGAVEDGQTTLDLHEQRPVASLRGRPQRRVDHPGGGSHVPHGPQPLVVAQQLLALA